MFMMVGFTAAARCTAVETSENDILSISTIYTIIQTSFTTVLLSQLFVTLPNPIMYLQAVYFDYFFWLLCLLLAFVCLSTPKKNNINKYSSSISRASKIFRIQTFDVVNHTEIKFHLAFKLTFHIMSVVFE